MPILEIKKRSGDIVPFDSARITRAMEKACIATETPVAEHLLVTLTEDVIAAIETDFAERMPSVEDVQDRVEIALAAHGLFEVAKSYIIYRTEHKQIRAQEEAELLERVEKGDLYVTKRNGERVKFNIDEIRVAIQKCIGEFANIIDGERVVEEVKSSLYDGIPTKDINRAVVLVLRAHIEEDPAYALVTARFLWNDLYMDVLGCDDASPEFDSAYRSTFTKLITDSIADGKLDPRMSEFDLDALARALTPKNDKLFTYLGAQTLYDTYFLRTPGKKPLEAPQHYWMRIAMGCAIPETTNKTEHAIAFYNIMSELLYTPSTPTLLHAGLVKPQLSSCFLNTVEDDLHNIFKVYADNAQLSKWSGGIGSDWTPIRATGSLIKGIGVESQGVIPFLKIANDVTVAINRSGKRRSAAAVYLETWHADIVEFLELRKNTGDERRRTHDINTANWIPDLFMKRVREDGEWSLFSPHEAPDLHNLYGKAFQVAYEAYEAKGKAGELEIFTQMKARDLWKKMLSMLFETGHPWITFKDPSNIRSPQDHVGVVHSSNLCTEITLNTDKDETAVCNLGSLNFAKFVRGEAFDAELVASVTTTAMRMLDNVIDINFYPTENTKRSNMRHRPVGLGIRGYQDALYALGIHFDSEAAVQFADESMEIISYYAIKGSMELAKERGAYETFAGSKWSRGIFPLDTIALLETERGSEIPVSRTSRLDWDVLKAQVKEHGMRNSNTMAIAPTATTANIVGCFPTVEPPYKNLYVKSNRAGEFVVVNTYLVADLKKEGLWTKDIIGKIKFFDGSITRIEEIPPEIRARHKEVFEIDARWIIRQAAERGKWVDQSQSINIFFSGTSGRELADIYMYAWEMGLKTTYYLRSLGATQVEKSTMSTAEYGVTHKRSSTSPAAQLASATITEASPTVIAAPEVVAIPTSASSPTPVKSVFIARPAQDEECETCSA